MSNIKFLTNDQIQFDKEYQNLLDKKVEFVKKLDYVRNNTLVLIMSIKNLEGETVSVKNYSKTLKNYETFVDQSYKEIFSPTFVSSPLYSPSPVNDNRPKQLFNNMTKRTSELSKRASAVFKKLSKPLKDNVKHSNIIEEIDIINDYIEPDDDVIEKPKGVILEINKLRIALNKNLKEMLEISSVIDNINSVIAEYKLSNINFLRYA